MTFLEVQLTDLDVTLNDLTRIDAGLEGDWSSSVQTVWTRAGGHRGFYDVVRQHETCRPSIELYFRDSWLGCHCYRRVDNVNVFDEAKASRLIDEVEHALGAGANSGVRMEGASDGQ